MRRIQALLLIAALLLAAPGVARAQYVMDLGSLITAIQVGDLNDAIHGVHDANTVYVARVSQIAGIRVQGERLTRAIERRQRVIWYFQRAIRGARVAMKALEVHGQTLEQVIYATFTNDRTATLYVDDR